MTEKWTNFAILFAAMLEKYGTNLPSENDMHTLLESIKEAKNDDIEHSDASLQEKIVLSHLTKICNRCWSKSIAKK